MHENLMAMVPIPAMIEASADRIFDSAAWLSCVLVGI